VTLTLVQKIRKLTGLVLRGSPIYLHALRQGVAASIEHERVLRNLGEIRTVLDLGANRGQFALVSRHCFPDATIVSFEPLSGPASRYRRVFVDDPAAVMHQVAIGPEAGEATIHVSKRDDSSSLLPITGMQNELFPGTAEAETKTIRVAPLADLVDVQSIQLPVLLKLDVQGFELEALRGCESVLGRIGFVYVECSFLELYAGQALADEVIAWLRERGFRLSGVFNMSYDASGRSVQADFLFERS
jgi:FkbM family methyltransferase